MDEDLSSAKLGLTGEDLELIREMEPDILEIAQGEEDERDLRAYPLQFYCVDIFLYLQVYHVSSLHWVPRASRG